VSVSNRTATGASMGRFESCARISSTFCGSEGVEAARDIVASIPSRWPAARCMRTSGHRQLNYSRDELLDINRLFQKIVGPRFQQRLDLAFPNHAGDDDNPHFG